MPGEIKIRAKIGLDRPDRELINQAKLVIRQKASSGPARKLAEMVLERVKVRHSRATPQPPV